MDILTDYKEFYSCYTNNKLLYYPISYWFVNVNTFPISFNAVSQEKGLNSILSYLGYEQRNAVVSGDLLWFVKARKQIDLLLQQEYDKRNFKLIHIMEELKNSIKNDKLFIQGLLRQFLKQKEISIVDSQNLMKYDYQHLISVLTEKIIAPKNRNPISFSNLYSYNKYKLLFIDERQKELQRVILHDAFCIPNNILTNIYTPHIMDEFSSLFELNQFVPYEILIKEALTSFDRITQHNLSSLNEIIPVINNSNHDISIISLFGTTIADKNMDISNFGSFSRKIVSDMDIFESNNLVYTEFKEFYKDFKINLLTKQVGECIKSELVTNVSKQKTLDSLRMISGAIKLDKNIDLNKLLSFITDLKQVKNVELSQDISVNKSTKTTDIFSPDLLCILQRNLIEKKREIYINADFMEMQKLQKSLNLDSYMYGGVIPNKIMTVIEKGSIQLNRLSKDSYLFDIHDFNRLLQNHMDVIDEILYTNPTPENMTVIKSNLAAIKDSKESQKMYKLYLVLHANKTIYIDLKSGFLSADKVYDVLEDYNTLISTIKDYKQSEQYQTLQRVDKIIHSWDKVNSFYLADRTDRFFFDLNPFEDMNKIDKLFTETNGFEFMDRFRSFVSIPELESFDKIKKWVISPKSIVLADRMRYLLYGSNMLSLDKIMKLSITFDTTWYNKVLRELYFNGKDLLSTKILSWLTVIDFTLWTLRNKYDAYIFDASSNMQLSKLKEIYIQDKFILDNFYRRWYFLPSDGPYDLMILPNDYPYSKNLLQGEGILQHPFPNGSDKALDEIPVDLNIMANVIDFCHELWYANCFLYSRYTPDQAVKHFVNLLFDWLDKYLPDIVNRLYEYYPDTYQIYPNPLTMMDEYWRLYRWIRWYAEAIVLNIPETDKDLLSGNVYVKKLVDDLVKYFNDHHGVYNVPGRKVFNKVKGIRHKWLEDYSNKIL